MNYLAADLVGRGTEEGSCYLISCIISVNHIFRIHILVLLYQLHFQEKERTIVQTSTENSRSPNENSIVLGRKPRKL